MNTLQDLGKTDHFCDHLSRIQKLFVDAGQVSSFEEAEKRLQTLQLSIEVGPNVAHSPTLQAAVLTAVNAAVRTFEGGVFITGFLDSPLFMPFQGAITIADAITSLGAHHREQALNGIPRLIFGDIPSSQSSSDLALQVTFNGWTGAVVPYQSDQRLAETQECELAGILAGSLAVCEAFQHQLGNVWVGRRAIGLSLWEPDVPWFRAATGPELTYLPKSAWIIGLGNLGQGYLWSLSMLPYSNLSEICLVLQDFDHLTASNCSTSMLSFSKDVGVRKTRAIADWCESVGFKTRLIERPFSDDFCRQTIEPFKEPGLALCGVDKADARRQLEKAGFDFIVEAGLGSGPQGFLNIGVHTFPGPRKAEDIWRQTSTQQVVLAQLPSAYRALKEHGFDDCGIIQIANRAVGTPFVGTIAATLVVSQPLRLLHGAAPSASIDWILKSPEYIRQSVNDLVTQHIPLEYVEVIRRENS